MSIPLQPAAVVGLHGKDAQAFAQAQFTSDVAALEVGHWQWSAWLDAQGRVLYIGTFSKSLFPSVRLAYMVLPEPLVQPLVTARTIYDGFARAFLAPITQPFTRSYSTVAATTATAANN